jgi:hypothetical protein
MLLDFKEGIPFVLLLIYVAKARFASQVHALLTGWRGSPDSENWDSLTNCMSVISHCYTCFMAFWIPFYVHSTKKFANEMQESSHSCKLLVKCCSWMLEVVDCSYDLHMFSLPKEEINCITSIKNQWGDELAIHSIVFTSEFFQSIFSGLFLIPLLLVYVNKASHSVLSDCQPWFNRMWLSVM